MTDLRRPDRRGRAARARRAIQIRRHRFRRTRRAASDRPRTRPRPDRLDHRPRSANSRRTNRHASKNSPAVASRANRSPALSARRSSGDCRCNSRPRRWCRGPIPRRWSNWRWNCCAPAETSIARCASPISAPAPAQFCWRCCPSCRRRKDSGPTFRSGALQTAGGQCGARGAVGSRDVHRLRLCERAVRPVRSDRFESALYPLGGYRRSGGGGAESRSRWPRSMAAPTGWTPTAR